MESQAHNTLHSKLQVQDSVIQDRLAELESKLLGQNDTTQKEIEEYLQKRENIANTIKFLNEIQNIEDEVELAIEDIKKKQKARERNYKMVRKSHIESRISDYKYGAARTIGTNMHDSYLDSVHYYQKQLSSLVSSLSS